MVKRVVVELDDAEHKELSQLKRGRTWKQVLVEGLKREIKEALKEPLKGETDE